MVEEAGFQVTEEIEIGDLTKVTDDQSMPKCAGVKVRIEKPAVRLNLVNNKEKEDSINNPCISKDLNAQLRITEEGVDGEGKYKNKVLFPNPRWFLWVDKTHEFFQGDKYQLETQSFLNPLKQMLVALGYDPKSPPKVNDEFLSAINGQELIVDITREGERAKINGEWVSTGGYVNRLRNIKAAA